VLERVVAQRRSRQQPLDHPYAEARLLAEVRFRKLNLISQRKISSTQLPYWLRRQLDDLSKNRRTKNPGNTSNEATNFKFFFQTHCPKMIAPKQHLHGTKSQKNTDIFNMH
jgi:hypothetical protein